MSIKRTQQLTTEELEIEKRLIDSNVSREDLIYYILETVHVAETDDLDAVVNSLLC